MRNGHLKKPLVAFRNSLYLLLCCMEIWMEIIGPSLNKRLFFNYLCIYFFVCYDTICLTQLPEVSGTTADRHSSEKTASCNSIQEFTVLLNSKGIPYARKQDQQVWDIQRVDELSITTNDLLSTYFGLDPTRKVHNATHCTYSRVGDCEISYQAHSNTQYGK